MKFKSYLTFNGDEIPVIVDFDYQPAEAATLEYPGCDAEVIINSIKGKANQMFAVDADTESRLTEEAFDYMQSLRDRNEAMLDERIEVMQKGEI